LQNNQEKQRSATNSLGEMQPQAADRGGKAPEQAEGEDKEAVTATKEELEAERAAFLRSGRSVLYCGGAHGVCFFVLKK
jgi:hypothetical protein